MEPHDKTAARQPWDRWQDVRMPETVDEADAAIRLVKMKQDAMETVASVGKHPERSAGVQFAADRWAEVLVRLEWAREVLRAGESPLAKQLRELRERHDALVMLASECPDTRTLIDTLLRRIQRAHELLDDRKLVRVAMEAEAEEAKAKNARLREMVTEMGAEIEAIRAASALVPDAVQREREIIKRQAQTIHMLREALGAQTELPDSVAKGKDARARRHQHTNTCLALCVIESLLASGGTLTDESEMIVANMLHSLPAGFRESWEVEEKAKILAITAHHAAERAKQAA